MGYERSLVKTPRVIDRDSYRRRASVITTFLTFLISYYAPVVMASECLAAPQKQAFRAAALVFRGRVLRVEDTTPATISNEPGKVALQPSEPSGPRVVTLRVSRIWKGPAASTIQLFVLEHPPLGTGFQFHVGSEYVIYALDQVDQDWAEIRPFSKKSRVYDIGVSCTLRVRSDVANESRLLDKTARRK